MGYIGYPQTSVSQCLAPRFLHVPCYYCDATGYDWLLLKRPSLGIADNLHRSVVMATLTYLDDDCLISTDDHPCTVCHGRGVDHRRNKSHTQDIHPREAEQIAQCLQGMHVLPHPNDDEAGVPQWIQIKAAMQAGVSLIEE